MAKKRSLKVTQHHARDSSESYIVVYYRGKIVARESVTKRKPYDYLKTLKRSKHFKSLERQLLPHMLTLKDIGLGQ